MRGARTLRVAGSGHSFTDAACTDGLLVDLARMRRRAGRRRPRRDRRGRHHAARPGEELASRGLALENQGDVDTQTLAGAISTATHGTGGRFANISSRVVGMRIVNGSGEAVDVRGEDELRAGARRASARWA